MQMFDELKPTLSRKIWGGHKLSQLKNWPNCLECSQDQEPIGETWEVSTHQDGESRLSSNDKKLSSITQLNYLIKFIDTSDHLSVQVHPGDDYAQKYEHQSGKTECWLILDADLNNADESGIFLGFKPGVTDEQFKSCIKNNGDASLFLNFFPVKPMDFFVVPAGTIHAIGKNVTMVEVQQSSGVTYRVWDWNRKDNAGNPRELHLTKAFDVIDFAPDKNILEAFAYQNFSNLIGLKKLYSHAHFEVSLLKLNKDSAHLLKLPQGKQKWSIVVLEGSPTVHLLQDEFKLKPYHSYFYLHASDSIHNQVKITASEHTSLLFVSD